MIPTQVASERYGVRSPANDRVAQTVGHPGVGDMAVAIDRPVAARDRVVVVDRDRHARIVPTDVVNVVGAGEVRDWPPAAGSGWRRPSDTSASDCSPRGS